MSCGYRAQNEKKQTKKLLVSFVPRTWWVKMDVFTSEQGQIKYNVLRIMEKHQGCSRERFFVNDLHGIVPVNSIRHIDYKVRYGKSTYWY